MLSSQTQFRHLKMQVQRKLTESLRLATAYFKREFVMPTVSYDLRGTKAGVAYLQKNEIKFNRTLLLENSTEFIRQVVPHELAHLIIYQVFGRVKPHGVEWKALMNQVFHLPAETCHQFDVQNVQGKTFEYRCHCQTHLLSIRRHNRILKEKVEYLCRKCKGKLIFVDDT
ncbi:SprT family zinc-dependent metalloprotease [Rodentibacter myodis]|uniref:Protein SprT n=1 Tax=Rodentibacter myodis TaxID=1907939 RepID=A0A1V3JPP4_9PAST|nr:SprT family zinc-dependent metalloprotease [Rodentibacter myodis]OOF58789.1 SprT family protein [Rodentibacter myodis]